MDGFPQSLSSSIFSSSPLLAAFSGRSTVNTDGGNGQQQSTHPASNGTMSSLLSRQFPGLTTKGASTSMIPSSASPQSLPLSSDLYLSGQSAPSPQASSAHGMEGKQERGRERRIMPARLQRVSNLLAGSTLEDELSGANAKQEVHLLPPQTNFILFSGQSPGFPVSDTDIKPQGKRLFASPEFVKACRIREMIETPDFKQRDDTEMMGKTRSIRSEEDTSDAAYERRHRKPDNLEKKQRRLEKERLVRDRQKLKERIDQLRVADARLLAPILNAREQQQKQTEGEVAAASPDRHDQVGQKQQGTTMDASQTMAKLELLRSELLEEAHDTLKRYDALLLAPTETALPLQLGKRRPGADSEAGGESSSKPARSISVSGAFASKAGKSQAANRASSFSAAASKEKRAAKRKSQSPLDVKTKRLSAGATLPVSPQPFKPEDGTVRAENTYANIHARTSGGRFAPKAALAGTGGSTSKINTKGKWKAEGGQGKPPRKPRTSSSSKAKAAASSSKGAAGSTDAVMADDKPKRVKIILNKRRKTAEGKDAESGSTSIPPFVDDAEGKVAVEADEMEVDSTPQRAARSALTLEEAQALLAKAMEDDDDDDDEEIELEVKREDAGNA